LKAWSHLKYRLPIGITRFYLVVAETLVLTLERLESAERLARLFKLTQFLFVVLLLPSIAEMRASLFFLVSLISARSQLTPFLFLHRLLFPNFFFFSTEHLKGMSFAKVLIFLSIFTP
jgi:hypothetical protein